VYWLYQLDDKLIMGNVSYLMFDVVGLELGFF